MTLRLTSTEASDVSETFSPSADFFLQINSAKTVIVDVEAQVDDGAPWAGIASIRSNEQPIAAFTALPFVRYRLRHNVQGNTVELWDTAE